MMHRDNVIEWSKFKSILEMRRSRHQSVPPVIQGGSSPELNAPPPPKLNGADGHRSAKQVKFPTPRSLLPRVI